MNFVINSEVATVTMVYCGQACDIILWTCILHNINEHCAYALSVVATGLLL